MSVIWDRPRRFGPNVCYLGLTPPHPAARAILCALTRMARKAVFKHGLYNDCVNHLKFTIYLSTLGFASLGLNADVLAYFSIIMFW